MMKTGSRLALGPPH